MRSRQAFEAWILGSLAGVHANIVHSNVWGRGDIWVNLAATDFGYVNVIGVSKTP